MSKLKPTWLGRSRTNDAYLFLQTPNIAQRDTARGGAELSNKLNHNG